MMKASFTKGDGTPVVVLGLTHDNLWGLVNVAPIVINLEEVGHQGKFLISYTDGEKVGVPRDESMHNLAFTQNALDMLKCGEIMRMGVESDGYTGEILLFSAKDERTMEEMITNAFPDIERRGGTSTCSKCRSARRDDGSCNCVETMQ